MGVSKHHAPKTLAAKLSCIAMDSVHRAGAYEAVKFYSATARPTTVLSGDISSPANRHRWASSSTRASNTVMMTVGPLAFYATIPLIHGVYKKSEPAAPAIPTRPPCQHRVSLA